MDPGGGYFNIPDEQGGLLQVGGGGQDSEGDVFL